ncbi:hypothetical protein Tco_0000647 [Tanacetum coccineum]
MLNNIMAAWSNASSPMLGQKIFTMEITVLIQAVPEAEGRPAVQTTIGIANWIDMIQYENKEHFQYENGSNFIAFNWALQQGGIVERTDVKTNLFWNLRSLLSEMENHGVVLLTLWGYGKRRLSVVQTGYSALTAWDSWALCKGMQEAKAGLKTSENWKNITATWQKDSGWVSPGEIQFLLVSHWNRLFKLLQKCIDVVMRLLNLIANLTLDSERKNKTILKQLKKANDQ